IRTILQPAIDGLRAEGRMFVGVLYAGLILTAQGPQVIEFNCRFGDPETQVILPLLRSDLLTIMLACAHGRLAVQRVDWSNGAAACVVLAAHGYPGPPRRGDRITGLENIIGNAIAFHAGTACAGADLVTAGGRVLGITGWGAELDDVEKTSTAAFDAALQ